ncbi:MAG: HAMP domain-containing protein [Gammaproteobacteria bacterium]|nr:HAMP domain-containing protein [Gammaproteobacteria bacterium]
MASVLNRRTLTSAVLMGLLFLVLVGSLYMLGTMALRLDRFGRYYHWLLAANILALSFIGVLIALNGWRLVQEWRARVAGSRLTVKLVILSVLLALMPVTLVYSFSIRFLRANINSYFDVEIEQALDDALELSRESLGLQMRTRQREALVVAKSLVGVDERLAVIELNSLSAESEASEMTLIGPDNRIIATTGLLNSLSVQPVRPDDDLLFRARQGLSYVGVDPIGNGDLYIRVVLPVLSDVATIENSVLHALYPIAERSAQLAESVQSSYQQYRQLVFLRRPLTITTMMTLSLALLLSVMMAVWFSFYAARRMMLPVHDLVEGTRSVADGDYGTRIDKRVRNDELGVLVQSFNYMTLQLEQSRDNAERSWRLVESQREYLEAVLGQISSGVLTLDAANTIRTCNKSAVEVLGEELNDAVGEPLETGAQINEVCGQFSDQIMDMLRLKQGDNWSKEIELVDNSGRRFIFCQGAALHDGDGDKAGMVIVFDDMTTIISAQRDAAWSEVARRLAHEIKNPLTPIQLSAERLRHKFDKKLDEQDGLVLKRLTQTIENQVDSMKSMVNAFAEYASAPQLSLVETDINQLLLELVDLYRETHESAEILLHSDSKLSPIRVDLPRIRQLVHNLIKNALEAQLGQSDSLVEIRARETYSRGLRVLELTTIDNGPGFPQDLMNRMFEPYITSKPKGTGLGLAIVKKIVEEHNGSIRAENLQSRGAKITVHLPYHTVLQIRGDAA